MGTTLPEKTVIVGVEIVTGRWPMLEANQNVVGFRRSCFCFFLFNTDARLERERGEDLKRSERQGCGRVWRIYWNRFFTPLTAVKNEVINERTEPCASLSFNRGYIVRCPHLISVLKKNLNSLRLDCRLWNRLIPNYLHFKINMSRNINEYMIFRIKTT